MKQALFTMALCVLASVAFANSPQESNPRAEWRNDESIAFNDARESGRHVVVVFGAEWCVPCKKIDQIMNEDIVFGLLSRSFVPLHFDITALTDSDEALQAKYRVPYLPAVIFIDALGQELGRWQTNMSRRGFIAAMQNVLASNPVIRDVGSK